MSGRVGLVWIENGGITIGNYRSVRTTTSGP